MKKFKFSLQRILEYFDHIVQKEKEALAILRSELIDLENEENRLKNKLMLSKTEFSKSSLEGITACEAKVYLSYIQDLRHLLEEQAIKIEQKNAEIEAQTEKLKKAMLEKAKTEKLRESKLREYNEKQIKADELFIEELLSFKNIATKA